MKQINKGKYIIEFDENQKYDESSFNQMVEDAISIIERKEKASEPYLIHKNGERVKEGDEVVDFRGDKAIVESWVAPKFEGKSGRVYVKEILKSGESFEAGYYPEVYGLKWIGLPWDKKEVEDVFVEDL